MASRIEGKVRMRKVLKILPDSVRKQIKAAVHAGAEDMASTMRNLVPTHSRTLRESIKVTAGDADPAGYAKLKSRRREGDPELAAVITAGSRKAFYARMVEFGTPAHINQGRFKGSQNPGTRAQPFFFPSYRARRKQVQARINKAARQGIKEGLK